MTDALKPYAKAIAALLTPIVLALLAKGARWVGVDVAFEPTVVQTAVTSIVTGALVYFTRNRTPI